MKLILIDFMILYCRICQYVRNFVAKNFRQYCPPLYSRQKQIIYHTNINMNNLTIHPSKPLLAIQCKNFSPFFCNLTPFFLKTRKSCNLTPLEVKNCLLKNNPGRNITKHFVLKVFARKVILISKF